MAPEAKAARPRKERVENAAKRRAQLIEATLRSIVRNGLANTTLATVSGEAGLSQGVAVFYFKTKQMLLAEALRAHYSVYRENWQRAFNKADPDPVSRIAALVTSDFDKSVCNQNALSVWHAFWGEAKSRPLYADITEEMDAPRLTAMRDCCEALLAELKDETRDATLTAEGIEAMTNGLWLWLYLSPDSMTRERALEITAQHLVAAFPQKRAEFLEKLGLS